SGEKTGLIIKRFVDATLRDSVPSIFATNKSLPVEEVIILPSGDDLASTASMSPIRCGEPPRTGKLHSGPMGGTPCTSVARSSEPSGDMANGLMFGDGRIVDFLGSPPVIDISSMPWYSELA